MGTSWHPAIPLSLRCPLGSIHGNHSGQNTLSSLSSVNDFSASAVVDRLFTAGRDLLVINCIKNACQTAVQTCCSVVLFSLKYLFYIFLHFVLIEYYLFICWKILNTTCDFIPELFLKDFFKNINLKGRVGNFGLTITSQTSLAKDHPRQCPTNM